MLQVGDIILTTTNKLTSKGIRTFTKSDISHAMLYVEPYSVIDSTGEGVQSHNTQRLIYEDNCQIHALRLTKKIPLDKLRLITDYARNCIGTEYSKFEASRTVIGGKKTPTKKQFCSRLVARAFVNGGIKLVKNEHFCTPEEILNSRLLHPIKNAVRSISKDEVHAIQNRPSTPDKMTETTNYVLNGARKLNSSIQNLSDLDHFVIKNPQYDSDIAMLYKESGFLTVWSFEKSKNEWQYDIHQMTSIKGHDEDIKLYCNMVTENPNEAIRRYEQNLNGYKYYLNQIESETFTLLHDLYVKLVDLHHKRINVAQQWLALHPDQ